MTCEPAAGNTLLEKLRSGARMAAQPVDGQERYVLFLSATGGNSRAVTINAAASTFDEAWDMCAEQIGRHCPMPRWLRLDWVTDCAATTMAGLRTLLAATKRNYFRMGIALDAQMQHAFLETELNANAMLYGGNRIDHAVLNERNFDRYVGRRFGIGPVDFASDKPVWTFRTGAMFLSAEDARPILLHGTGRNTGRRITGPLTEEALDRIIASGARYLARQVGPDGRFDYGCHPCFDRPIRAYNSLRHASSLYAMLEAWEVEPQDDLQRAIERAADHLVRRLVRTVSLNGKEMAFVVENDGEIKLGASGVCLLALVKYSELFCKHRHRALLTALGEGILHMQDQETGAFHHVLHYPSLEVKEAFRIIYYDGEAAFGLVRLYGLTREPRWLAAVERAFGHFVRQRHWQAHDHWMGYCINELCLHQPREAYFRFGLRNFRSHLHFVLDRVTTFPTLLELMNSAERLIARMADLPGFRDLLNEVDLDHVYEALHFRAHYVLNGHFWPELAMFFERPDKIQGSFFIRHHAFRVRIDDVEHYLSGLIGYRNFLRARGADHPADPGRLEWQEHQETGWNARNVALATGGAWQSPPGAHWKATGVFIHSGGFVPGRIAAVRVRDGEKGITPADLIADPVKPAAVLSSNPRCVPIDVPQLWVESPQQAVMDMARYARARFRGKVIGVTGSAGKTTTVGMMAHVLRRFGLVGQTSHNANLPLGVAWNLASMRWDDAHVVLELGVGRMGHSAALAKPDVAIFTNILPAHLEYHKSLQQIARLKSRMFLGMASGATAVLYREMNEWETVHASAAQRRLNVCTYGRSPQCEYRLLEYDPATQQVSAELAGHRVRYRIGAAGEHMALNSLAVIAAAHRLGHAIDPALEQIATFKPIAGRGAQIQSIVNGKPIRIIDESYNANPGSMKEALSLLAQTSTSGRRIAVLGEMAELGPDAKRYHTELAPLISAYHIDRVFALGELYADFWPALPCDCRGAWASSLQDLACRLTNELSSGDCVLVKGSHSTGMFRLAQDLCPPVMGN